MSGQSQAVSVEKREEHLRRAKPAKWGGTGACCAALFACKSARQASRVTPAHRGGGISDRTSSSREIRGALRLEKPLGPKHGLIDLPSWMGVASSVARVPDQ